MIADTPKMPVSNLLIERSTTVLGALRQPDNGVLEDLAADPPWFSRSETVKGRFVMGKDFWDRCATL